ncbi:dihydrolipoamide acetyltransferase family protein [soil metagenome]
MPREFLLPELAESVVEGEIVKWLVEEGDTVEEDQPLVEVMTDKVTVELPSPFAGVLEKRLAAEGDIVPVHAPIALFADGEGTVQAVAKPAEEPAEEPGNNVQAAEERSIVESGNVVEDDGESLSLFKPSAALDEGPGVQVRKSGAAVAEKVADKKEAEKKVTGPYGRVLAVPAARKLARDLGLDIAEVAGSGPNGRVRVDDVRAHADTAQINTGQINTGQIDTGQAPTPAQTPVPETKRIAYQTPEDYADLEERVTVRGLRRAISNQMLASHLQTVRTLHVDEADMTALFDMRARLKPVAEERGVKLSYLPFIMKAVVAALKRFPIINSSLDETSNEIVRKRYYNLGVAVATESGLVVPVVHEVDRKSILEIAEDVTSLAAKARDGKLAPGDVKNGTFSITNIGTLGGLFSFPIINVPEAAILGVHSIKKRPVVLPDDSIVARQMLYLSLSFDHRIIDGAEAAMFTSALIKMLETPESLLLEL